MSLESIPPEVIIYIMVEALQMKELETFKKVSRRIYSIYSNNSEYIYKKKLISEFPHISCYKSWYIFAKSDFSIRSLENLKKKKLSTLLYSSNNNPEKSIEIYEYILKVYKPTNSYSMKILNSFLISLDRNYGIAPENSRVKKILSHLKNKYRGELQNIRAAFGRR